MSDKMKEEIKSLNSERYRILKMIEEYEGKRKDLMDKMNKDGVSLEIEPIEKATGNKPGEKSNKILTGKSCWYHLKGYCKRGSECKYSHESDDCIVHVNGERCGNKSCKQRHIRDCKHWMKGFCFRAESCGYLHKTFKNNDNLTIDTEEEHNKIKEENAELERELDELKVRNAKLFEALRIETKRSHELDIQVKLLKRRLGEVVSDSEIDSEGESD